MKNMTKEERKEYDRQRYLQKRKEILEYQKQYRETNKKKIAEYFKTPMGRAQKLVQTYKRNDKKHGRGECTLTAKWIVENIFTKKCAHCNKEGWQVIGCNRLDNSKPHTPDNVEPCCFEHNNELNYIERSKQVYQYTKEGELVKVWNSVNECGRNGYHKGAVWSCCNGRVKTHKGFIWSYNPITLTTIH